MYEKDVSLQGLLGAGVLIQQGKTDNRRRGGYREKSTSCPRLLYYKGERERGNRRGEREKMETRVQHTLAMAVQSSGNFSGGSNFPSPTAYSNTTIYPNVE